MSYGTTAIFIESYKTRQMLLKNAAAFLLKNSSMSYYKPL